MDQGKGPRNSKLLIKRERAVDVKSAALFFGEKRPISYKANRFRPIARWQFAYHAANSKHGRLSIVSQRFCWLQRSLLIYPLLPRWPQPVKIHSKMFPKMPPMLRPSSMSMTEVFPTVPVQLLFHPTTILLMVSFHWCCAACTTLMNHGLLNLRQIMFVIVWAML